MRRNALSDLILLRRRRALPSNQECDSGSFLISFVIECSLMAFVKSCRLYKTSAGRIASLRIFLRRLLDAHKIISHHMHFWCFIILTHRNRFYYSFKTQTADVRTARSARIRTNTTEGEGVRVVVAVLSLTRLYLVIVLLLLQTIILITDNRSFCSSNNNTNMSG